MYQSIDSISAGDTIMVGSGHVIQVETIQKMALHFKPGKALPPLDVYKVTGKTLTPAPLFDWHHQGFSVVTYEVSTTIDTSVPIIKIK